MKMLRLVLIVSLAVALTAPLAVAGENTDEIAAPILESTWSASVSASIGAWSLTGPSDGASAQAAGAASGSPLDTMKTSADYMAKWPGPFWRTSFEVILVNEVIWLFNRYIREGGSNPGFRVGFNSLENNLKNGFEWDDNNFSTNHFLHPYHGSLYFTGARANGYSYWEAIPFTFAGSWLWEYWGEVHHPSINDWINTSVGGIAFGEVLYRFSNLVYDNTDTGSSRTWREIGGFLVAPVHGLNRILTGEAFEVFPNPPDRHPSSLSSSFDIGLRTIGQDRFWQNNSTKAFVRFKTKYGDPFVDTKGKPFDNFDFGIMFALDNPEHGLQRIEAKGLIYAETVSQSENTQHVLGVQQHFDYYDNEAYTFGNQSISASFFSKFVTEHGFETKTMIHLNGVIMGASKSDYFNVSGRDYDYGPGVGFKFSAEFGREGRRYLGIAHEEFIIHSINGNRANHYVNFTGLYADVPLRGFLGLKFEYLLYLSERYYKDFPDVSERSPEIRVYFSFDS